MQFYKRCKRWKKEIVENPDAKFEKEKFITSTIVENMLKEISNRIGVELDFGKISNQYSEYNHFKKMFVGLKIKNKQILHT